MQYRKALLLTVVLFVCVSLLAQLTESGGQYPFVHYTPKDGLVNSRVRKAYQDSKGRMYFITYGGLSVYDGARFRNYTTQNGLLAGMVNDVLEVGDDSLLVAVNGCGLNVLVHGRMKQLDIAKDSCPVFNQFLKSNDGNIYATTDNGLYKIKKNGVQKLSSKIPRQKKIAVFLGAIAEYNDFLVFTTNDLRHYQGLFLYNKKTNTITDALSELFVYSLKKDYSNIIWLSTDKTVAVLDTLALSKGKLELRKPYVNYINPALPESGAISFNRQNELHIATGSNGITRYNKDGTQLLITSQELSALTVLNFFVDNEGVIWICHDGNGIYKLSNTKLSSSASFLRENKSGIKLVRTNSPDTHWVVTTDNKFTLHTSFTDRSFNINIPIYPSSLFYNNDYLYTANRNELYIASLPADNETIIRLRQILKVPDSSSFGAHFVSDPYGNIILSEHRNICVLQKDKLLFTYPINTYDLIEGMYIDRNKLLWVISRGNGLQIFSLHPENPSHYLQQKNEFIKELENASARCMTVDKNEMLWVGTRYNGLMAFKNKNNSFILKQHFQTVNGLTDNYVTSLASDKDGNIIIGTQTGLDRLIKTGDSSYRIENITKSNNIFSYINTVWTDAVNNTFALTNGGNLLQAEPVQHSIPGYEPQLLIEEIKINGKVIAYFSSSLQLNHLQRNITFSVAAPSFIDEQQIKYSYLLKGSGSKEWSDTTSVADITLLNLSPGSYTLHVKAFFPSTNYSSKEIDFSFTILPPWWQTWWFRIGMAILCIGVLAGSIRFYYRRKLEKQATALEKQKAVEKERTRIATDMHDDLGAGLSTIRFLSEKVKRNSFSDVTKGDAEKIVTNSNDLVQKMNEIIWAMNEKNDTLEDLLYYTRSYAAEYCEENNLTCETYLPQNIPSVFVSGEIRRNVFLIVKESLHNIVKHANAEKVIIDFTIDTALLVTVKDDGKGFSENGKSNGNGLRNMQKRMETVKGSFEITDANGVMVKIKVPLKL